MCCVTELEVRGFEESACRPQETVLVMAVWRGRREGRMDQAGRGVQLKAVGGGAHVKKRTEGIQDEETFTRKVHINCCYLQVQQSFKFPVE